MYRIILSVIFFSVLVSCTNDDKKTHQKESSENKKENKEKLFVAHSYKESGLKFINDVEETLEENYLNYEFIYNGSGVAVGDINNDGLADVYFAGNSKNDKLFLNQGGLKFSDVTQSSGVAETAGWSTGVSMIDINNDGWLDIYVCRSGPGKNLALRKNKLFINKKDGTFTEQSEEYGIDSNAYSVQAAFFDYDLDGDLDMYLLNHPKPSFKAKNVAEHIKEIQAGKIKTDIFYENDNGTYVDKTVETGLSNFGYRHGIAIGDINEDGLPDIFISSDFEEPDVLEINQGDGTFKNEINTYFNHISYNSMGNEMVDVNNDGKLDLFVVDMAPDDHFRSKAYMKSMDVEKFNSLQKSGYNSQYMFNTLQVNNGQNSFSEVAQLSGIAKTDWSWAPLFFDMDLDGDKDLFVTNGIKENFLFRDINTKLEERKNTNGDVTLQNLLDVVPSDVSENIFYENTNGLKFKNVSGKWAEPSLKNSNGVATADFDNDGDLDFVTNNMGSYATLYEGRAIQLNKNSLTIKLKGDSLNTKAIGARVKVITKEGAQIQELYNVRGYLSSVDYTLLFGLADHKSAEVEITWTDGQTTRLDNLAANTLHTIDYNDVLKINSDKGVAINYLSSKANAGINFVHKEDVFNDYGEQILLPHSQSTVGPAMAAGDLNNDGLEDLFIGGAAGEKSQMYVQSSNGDYIKKDGPWSLDSAYEDTGALFVDSDADGDMDLYVVSGGAHRPEGDALYADRLYLNNGNGNYTKAKDKLPKLSISGQAIAANDVDNDGDIDLFIGGRVIPDKYPYAPSSYILLNTNGVYTEVNLPINDLVADALFTDYDADGDKDLLIAGEWSKLVVLNNENGKFKRATIPSLDKTTGLWFGLAERDIDGDGDLDYFAGNIGLNTKYKVSGSNQFHIYAFDFDKSGSMDIVLSTSYKGNLVPARGRECSSQQMPFIEDKFQDYRSFASATLKDIYGEDLKRARHKKAEILASVFLRNNGDGSFDILELPLESQFSPVRGFGFIDMDKDGKDEIVTVGNLYNVEVETQRYDASKGNILKYNDALFSSIPYAISGFKTSGDARDVTIVKGENENRIIVTNNNGPLDVFIVNK